MQISSQTMYLMWKFAGLSTRKFLIRYQLLAGGIDGEVFAFQEFAVSVHEEDSWHHVLRLMEAVAKDFLKSRQLSTCEVIFQIEGSSDEVNGQKSVTVALGTMLDMNQLEERFSPKPQTAAPTTWFGGLGTWLATGVWPRSAGG